MGVFARQMAVLAALLAAGGALAWGGPPTDDVPGMGMSAAQWSAQSTDVQIATLAGLAGWLLLAWLVLAALASAAAALPGVAGLAGGVIAGRVAPAVVRRAMNAAMGLAVVASVAAPSAALASPVTNRPAAVERMVAAPAAGPSQLGDRIAAAVDQAPSQLGDRVIAVSVAFPQDDEAPAPFDRPAAATNRPAAEMSVVGGARRAVPAAAESLVVRRGDTLWSIAREHLPPGASDEQVDAHWRRWYGANRDVIGADPDLITPGTRLTPPPDAAS